MHIIKKPFGPFPLGVWLALSAILLILVAWIMQAYSLLNWENAVQIGFQAESFQGDKTESAIANIERGIAIADIVWALPLWAIALIGLLRKTYYGFIAAMMEFSICIYFPLLYMFRVNVSPNVFWGVLFLWAIPSFLGIGGLWINREIFK